jgi:hypothetical protein
VVAAALKQLCHGYDFLGYELLGYNILKQGYNVACALPLYDLLFYKRVIPSGITLIIHL